MMLTFGKILNPFDWILVHHLSMASIALLDAIDPNLRCSVKSDYDTAQFVSGEQRIKIVGQIP